VAERLRARFGAGRICLVADDRGMIAAEAIAALEAAGMDYLLGVRERSLREAGAVIEDDGAVVPLVVPRAKNRETQLEAKAVEVGGRRYIVCRNEERAAEDAATRAAILAAQGRTPPEWNRLVTDLADLSAIEVEQDGCRAQLRTAPGPAIDPVCRALGLALPPVFQEMPPAPPPLDHASRTHPAPPRPVWCLNRPRARKALRTQRVPMPGAKVGPG
jgi:hypothetical protein